MNYGHQEALLLILIGDCFVERFTNKENVEVMRKLCDDYVTNIYRNCIVCNPIILEQALMYSRFNKSPYIMSHVKKDRVKKLAFFGFINKNSLPYNNSPLFAWRKYKFLNEA
jgi:hypothetical protein